MTLNSEIDEGDPLTITQANRNVVTDLNRKALLRQIYMSVLCVSGPLVTGACYSQPSITIDQLTDPNEPVFLSKDQASWYGESLQPSQNSHKKHTKSNFQLPSTL